MVPSGLDREANKGKTKKKGKGKGKPKGRAPTSSSPSKGKRKGGKKGGKPNRPPGAGPPPATPDTVYLRCGTTGHYARDCSHASRKRQHTGNAEDQIGMVHHEEIFASEFKDIPSAAIINSGATSFIAGDNTVRNYLNLLKEKKFHTTKINIFECLKTFRFGNDQTNDATKCIVLPVLYMVTPPGCSPAGSWNR